MHTRSGARTRSISLPPPASPNLVGQAREVSNKDVVPESADLSWSGQGFEQRNEPAVRICNPDSVEARISSCPSLGEVKEELGSENLEPGSGDRDSPARGAVDYGFVTPTRYARNDNGSVSRSSWTSNELYFPKWFNTPRGSEKEKRKKKFIGPTRRQAMSYRR